MMRTGSIFTTTIRGDGGGFWGWGGDGVPILFCVDVSFKGENEVLLENKPDT